jgi:hypothetical protein
MESSFNCGVTTTLQQLGSTVSHEASIRQTLLGSLDAVVLDNGLLRLTLVPELGGKITSIVRLESGYEYLLQPDDPERAYRPRSYSDSFESHDTSGFDECVPTVAECRYPEEPCEGRQLPDHGDVWCLPSTLELTGEQIRLTTFLKSLPLCFTRRVQLQENTVRLDYEVRNLTQSTVKFLWSAHPLLRVETGAEIILPPEVKEVEVGWSKDNRLGKSGDRCSWPKATESSGQIIDINRVTSPSTNTAEKLFTPRLSEGFCGMFLRRENESILFCFDPSAVRYVGIWICQGGWPSSRTGKHFTVALEPCNGRPDSLETAIRRNECAVLGPSGTMQWWMEIEINRGAPRSQQM